ncbi:MAG: potassium transporter Kef [Oceanospirillaceae bacterium]|uniref:cation:proton antiporter family protein n=1 Tax=unclassified Thalassolituus TaxID=2624967 RepID=UPI000C39F087|nr:MULTISPECIES: cation:proton antiporter family protein [unclassified Thalassolituus]MBL34753.1 potassium transporter Kef [Oceanospirillaceae bacterium]MBS52827.1 potassium transporter Kef [Oceanospirillaceae bacterium]|tara:strand:+ start:2695 stop:4284 length:1590 start_codon:yes stop_codon:yes gene_type:complete
MDYLWVLVAFAFGFGVKQLGMPPLVGFLLAGFGLHAIGVEPTGSLNTLADLGITLMLFTIGLKLNISALLKKEVLVTTLAHTSIWVVLGIGLLFILALPAIGQYFDLSLQSMAVVAFALSFSSTVCVVKMLEEASELKARHGKTAIGILVLQDVIAVGFLVASTGKIPSVWALGLIGLLAVRPVLHALVTRTGHDELLPLVGFFMALGGYELFTLLNLKGDLGALVAGMMLASHVKAAEIYKALMGFKDLFLIGFFLSIGFIALPDVEMLLTALVLLLLLPVKFLLFFRLLTWLGMSGRSSYLSSLALTNFSEFGLIVANVGAENDWISDDWLVIIALVMSMSFVISSYFFRRAHHFYARHKDLINRYEQADKHQKFKRPKDADILIVGMGRVGKGAYAALEKEYGARVWGIESDQERALHMREEGLNVVAGDSDDFEFWQQATRSELRLIMLALPSQIEMRSTLDMLRMIGYQGKVAAVARYEDERKELIDLGVDVAFNYYSEVGSGFAAESRYLLEADNSLDVAAQV